MKLISILVGFLIFILVQKAAYAQVQNYIVTGDIDEKGRSFLKYSITFSVPVDVLKLNILGKLENFAISSNAGPVDCKTSGDSVAIIDCSLHLTKEKRTVELSYETNDFVKDVGGKFYFNGDFGLNYAIDQVTISIKIPEGAALSNFNNSISVFPTTATTLSDGRRIIVFWKQLNVPDNLALRYQIFFERISQPPLFQLRLSYFVILGLSIAGAAAFIYLKYYRKPQELVFSVLDDYERKVMNSLVGSGGEVNQKKIVQDTNLSKAKVSRIVKSLSERGLIQVEKTGRTNKIKIVKKKLEL